MHRPSLRLTAACATAATLFAAASTAVPAGAADGPKRFGQAKIVSVDGPGLVTVRPAKGKTKAPIAIRLIGIDTPQPGECGAQQSEDALRAITANKKRLSNLGYTLVHKDSGGLERDADGRFLGRVHYRVGGSYGYRYELGAALVDTAWARSGFRDVPGAPVSDHLEQAAEAYYGETLTDKKTGAPRGIWGACGGLMHHPADQPVPATSAVPWMMTAQGVTTSIGPLALPALLTPASTLTIGSAAIAAASAGPMEVVRFDGSCTGYIPSLQIAVYGWTYYDGDTCAGADVQAVLSFGPGKASTDRGLRVGDPITAIRPRYPLVDKQDIDSSIASVPLAGSHARVWAWQTTAALDDDSQIEGLTAYSGPPALD